jgi:thioredoxin:protein disulfide reductase
VTAWLMMLLATTAMAQQPLFEPQADPRAQKRVTAQMRADPSAFSVGKPVTLRVDVVPAPGIHVYAPGNRDYVAVSLSLDPLPGVRRQQPVYPEGEDYVFGELQELVKVYQRPFQIRQTLVVERPAEKAGELTVTGSLRYQACDDRVCFRPATIPLKVTIPAAR